MLGRPAPTGAELVGAVLLIIAIVILSVGPRMTKKDVVAAGEP